MTPATLNQKPVNDANRLGLDYRAEAARFAYTGPIIDIHTHVGTAEAARLYFEVADLFGVTKTVSMTKLENIDAITEAFGPPGERIEFIAVPNYEAAHEPGTFTTDWLYRMEKFREKGCRIIKFWAAPRGRDLHHDAFHLDSPTRRESIRLAYDLGYRVFMTHVGDPDTWFAAKYTDPGKYGTKREQFKPLEDLLDEYHDVTWIGAHIGGSPEDLDFVQGMLDRHPNYVLDTSAAKWQVRELSKHPERFRALCERNPGRVLFGTDIVANNKNLDFDLYASRYWALRTLIETNYVGQSPIVDPDLNMVDPSLDEKSTAQLRGAGIGGEALKAVYHDAAARVLG
jgi:Amidohydrolase